jgi:hypothetical protein
MSEPPEEAPGKESFSPYHAPEADVSEREKVKGVLGSGCSRVLWFLLPLVAGGFGCSIVGTATQSPWVIGGYGFLQLIYVIPLCVSAHRAGRRDKLAALIIGASLVFLLSAACGEMMGRGF